MNEVETKDVGTTDLSAYMMKVIEELRRDRKPPAVHIYACTLRSFIRFSCSGEEECSMPMQEVFTPGRLKEYEQWMLLRKLTQNTISTYMRTLRAVYNRWMPPGTAEHNPRLFDDVCGVADQACAHCPPDGTVAGSRPFQSFSTAAGGTCLFSADVLAPRHAFHRPCPFAQARYAGWQDNLQPS